MSLHCFVEDPKSWVSSAEGKTDPPKTAPELNVAVPASLPSSVKHSNICSVVCPFK